MLSGDRQRPITVAIDARLVSGASGGVEGVVAGIASGLRTIGHGEDRYVFLAWEGHDAWLRPYVSGDVSVAIQPATSELSAMPAAAGLVRMVRAARRAVAERRQVDTGPLRDRFLESIGADVVHFPIQWGARTNLPSIYHPHDLQHVHLPQYFTDEERRRRETWYGFLCRQARIVAVSSTWTKLDVEKHFALPPNRVRVVPLAPPIEASARSAPMPLEDVRARLGLPATYLVYPAQTWPHKNHLGLLAGLSRLRADHGLAPVMVFTGAQTGFAEEIRRRTVELGLDHQVHWTGFLEPGVLAAVIAGAHGVVIPSRFESASGPLWEAFSAGVPAACSNVTSLPRQAGDAALIFDPDDAAGIALALRAILSDDALRDRLVRAGRRQVAGFSWERTARHFRAAYRELAGRALTEEDRHLVTSEAIL